MKIRVAYTESEQDKKKGISQSSNSSWEKKRQLSEKLKNKTALKVCFSIPASSVRCPTK